MCDHERFVRAFVTFASLCIKQCAFFQTMQNFMLMLFNIWTATLSYHASGSIIYMSLVTRKPVFGVCDHVRLKPARSASEAGYSLEILD